MEHFRSTLSTTAAIVTSLAAASHILYPSDPGERVPRARPAVLAETAPTWTDPPTRAALVGASRTTVALDADNGTGTPRAASFTLLPVPVAPRSVALQPERPRKAEPARARKLAQGGVRGKQTAAAGGAVAARSSTDSQAAKFDPIGDLLRGLGIGRSEG